MPKKGRRDGTAAREGEKRERERETRAQVQRRLVSMTGEPHWSSSKSEEAGIVVNGAYQGEIEGTWLSRLCHGTEQRGAEVMHMLGGLVLPLAASGLCLQSLTGT